jgi:hypothetical protein
MENSILKPGESTPEKNGRSLIFVAFLGALCVFLLTEQLLPEHNDPVSGSDLLAFSEVVRDWFPLLQINPWASLAFAAMVIGIVYTFLIYFLTPSTKRQFSIGLVIGAVAILSMMLMPFNKRLNAHIDWQPMPGYYVTVLFLIAACVLSHLRTKGVIPEWKFADELFKMLKGI